MNTKYILICILIMAAVTYLARATSLLLFRKRIKNRFITSFLLYMPYGVLTAMVFPGILYSTKNMPSAIIGGVAALITSYFNLGLFPVALISTLAVFIIERFI